MSVSNPLSDRYGLGPIDQISFAVADVDEAATRYSAIFGPFEVVDVPKMDITWRGEPSTVTFKLGFGRSGGLEIELVQVVDGDSPAREHVENHGEGFNHVRFPVSSIEEKRSAMEREGWVTIFSGKSGDVSFAFLQPPSTLKSSIVELIEGLSAGAV
jgi:hypothetical protein